MPDKNVNIFSLLSECLFDNKHASLSTEEYDWGAVHAELKQQAIVALPYYWLKRVNLPDRELQEKWINDCMKVQSRWVKVMFAQNELLKLLDANNIPCVILKGAAAAMAYPYPYLRASGDVDFLVKRADFEKTARLLEDNSFSLMHEKNDEHHHYGYKKYGISFELHRRLGIVQEEDDELLALFERGIDEREFHEINGYSFPVFPQYLNGASLLFHINQHLRHGLGLRQIIDWMMYINVLPETVWTEELLPFLRMTGMERLALTVTGMCQDYFGLRHIVSGYEDCPCEELMTYILEKGNFGRKSGKKGKVSSVFLLTTNPVGFFKRLQAGGLSRSETIRHNKFLHPFAWIFQIGSVTKELIQSGMTPEVILRQRTKGLRQRKLIRELGLDIDRKIKRPQKRRA